ncbi:MAG: 50S ribosomal protein L21 [Rubrobacter sp.]|nr:50S ribosomal protein L21 [Rubrobacter sp.]
MYAVLNAGGKQYRANADQELVVDRLPGEVGETVELPISFKADGDDFDFGGSQARVEILEHLRGEKIHIYKYRPKKTYKKKTGHRQELTRIKVTEV